MFLSCQRPKGALQSRGRRRNFRGFNYGIKVPLLPILLSVLERVHQNGCPVLQLQGKLTFTMESDNQFARTTVSAFSFVTVVSGLPRSGTSMLMRMLQAGGMPVLTDEIRAADPDNPRGYFEFERVKRLAEDKDWLPEAQGKAVKVISFLLGELPSNRAYRVVFIRRSLSEVLASQRAMLARRDIPVADPAADDRRMGALYRKHLWQVERWLAVQPNVRALYVDHRGTIARPADTARAMAEFLGGGLDIDAMTSAVDPGLHRQRAG